MFYLKFVFTKIINKLYSIFFETLIYLLKMKDSNRNIVELCREAKVPRK